MFFFKNSGYVMFVGKKYRHAEELIPVPVYTDTSFL